LKILLATYWLIPHLGGLWPYMLKLKEKLEQLGHEVDILGKSDNGSFYIWNEQRYLDMQQLLPMLHVKAIQPAYTGIMEHDWMAHTEADRYAFELSAAYLGLQKYDLIHTQDVIAALGISRVKPKQTALICSVHGDIVREVYLSWHNRSQVERESSVVLHYYGLLERKGASVSDHTITSCPWLKNKLVYERGVPPYHVTIIPYGLDIPQFLSRSQQYIGSDLPVKMNNEKVILCTARLIRLKGIHVLLNALSLLKQQRRDWVCWIAGNGESELELQEQMRALGLQDRVTFLGRREDVPSLLRVSDIYVMPALHDTLPYAVMEAMIAGKAVVASNAGGLPDMVKHEQNGLVYAADSADQLCSHLNVLLEDAVFRKRLGDSAKLWGVAHYSQLVMYEQLFEVYRQVMKSRGWQ
jgi:glycosyltransferase involved in cell wall biosynthesis